MRNKIIKCVEKEKIIVIIRGLKKESLIPVAQAMYNGGIRLLEITYDAKGIVPDEETAENIRTLSKYFEGRMFIGAGTVLTEKQVELTKDAGGTFIISPDTNPEVIKKTVESGLVSMPGAFSPTEIQKAYLAGADFVKLFPVTNLGTDYVKAITAPLSHIKILAVGGIDDSNMKNFLDAGVCGFGIGSNIVDKKLVEAGDYKGIENLARKYTAVIGNE